MNFFDPNIQEQARKLQSNPREFIQKVGANIPEEIMNDHIDGF